MQITRLGWAGLELRAGGRSAVVDLFHHVGRMEAFVGPPRTPLPGTSNPGHAALALATHLHDDHTDPAALATALAPGAIVLRPEPATGGPLELAGTAIAEAGLREHGLATQVVAPWETVEVGPFRATAVPAVDGFGEPQISWVVEAEGIRILHAGDTLFHGSWWAIRERTGPIDVAFLPVNGPIASLPHRQPPSAVAAAMTPAQAAAAAAILQPQLAVPIHYDTLYRAPTYIQTEDPAGAFLREAAALGVTAAVVEPGQAVPSG